MCSPVLVVTAAATLYSAYSQKQAADGQARAVQVTAENNQKVANYNASVQDVNAGIQENAAHDALSRGAQAADTQRQKAIQANATGRAAMAGGGLLTDTGTNLDLLANNSGSGELNALTIFNNSEREAYGYEVAKTNDMAEAQNLRLGGQMGVTNAGYQADVLKKNGLLAASSTLVTGAADFGKQGGFGKSADSWYTKRF